VNAGCMSLTLIMLVFSGHTAAVGQLAFADDGRMLLTGSEDGSVKAWGVPEGPAAPGRW
jgi:WD40 repeat protein